jgi:hypothetical protein
MDKVMKAEEYQERLIVVGGWPVNVSSYRFDTVWHAKADNFSPGASLARATGNSREEAESAALKRAEELLGRTRVQGI